MSDTRNPERSEEWEEVVAFRCVICPQCAFTFDADHRDTDGGGYSCPVCAEAPCERSCSDRDRLTAALESIHHPVEEDAEVWADGDESLHAEMFPDCRGDCGGHDITIQVCAECGYEHDGDYPMFRRWPCPTARAVLAAVKEREAHE